MGSLLINLYSIEEKPGLTAIKVNSTMVPKKIAADATAVTDNVQTVTVPTPSVMLDIVSNIKDVAANNTKT